MAGTGGREAEAITALCAAPQVILDAEMFAALAARELLEVAQRAFAGRLRYVPLTATLLRTEALIHIHDGFVAVEAIATQIDSFTAASTLDERLAQAAQIRAVAARWDADWKPPRAEAAVMSLLAAKTHGAPIVTAYPEAWRLLPRPAGLCRVVGPHELALFLAHRGGYAPSDAGALAVELGAAFQPSRSKWWNDQRPRYLARADEAATGQLCNATH